MAKQKSNNNGARTIFVKRSSERDRGNFFKIGIANLEKASRDLKTAGAFKLFVYLCANADGYTFSFYPVNFYRRYGVSKSTYDRAFEELLETGYLLQSENDANTFFFNEISDKTKEENCNDVIASLTEEDYKAARNAYLEKLKAQKENQIDN